MLAGENRKFRIDCDSTKDIFREKSTVSKHTLTQDFCQIPKSTTFTYLPDILQENGIKNIEEKGSQILRERRGPHPPEYRVGFPEYPASTLEYQAASEGRKRPLSQEDVYDINGGTSLVITAHNKLIIASDTRHSFEYTINSRKMTKIFKIGKFYLTTTGFFADSFEIYTQLSFQLRRYETYGEMSLSALAHMTHNILYSRRFFPYYTYCILSGMENGEATVYSYDPVGSYQKTKCRCNGSGSVMIQPLLDSWISGKNFKGFQELSFPEIVELVKKAFDAASERDVTTKDYLEIYIVDEDGEGYELVELRHD